MAGLSELDANAKAFFISMPRKCPACGTVYDPPTSRWTLGVGIAGGLTLVGGAIFLQTLPADERPTWAQIAFLVMGPFVIVYCVRRWLKGGAAHILFTPESPS